MEGVAVGGPGGDLEGRGELFDRGGDVTDAIDGLTKAVERYERQINADERAESRLTSDAPGPVMRCFSSEDNTACSMDALLATPTT